jgi:hypothetical protein
MLCTINLKSAFLFIIQLKVNAVVYKRLMMDVNERSMTCYLLTRRIISGLRILYLNLLDVLGGITMACNTSNLISHKPVTSSGVNYSWGTFVTSCCVELLWWTVVNCYRRLLWRTPVENSCHELLWWNVAYSILNCLYNLGDQLLVCSLPRYMRAYRTLLSCNNSPLFRLPGYLAYRTVGSNLVVSADT